MADVEVRHLAAELKHRNNIYDVVWIDVGKRRIQVTISPTGKSIQVHVDGKKWEVRRG